MGDQPERDTSAGVDGLVSIVSPPSPQPASRHPTPPISRGGAKAAILSRLAAQGRSPDFLDDDAVARLIDYARGSPRVLRAALDSTLAQAAQENARRGDAALVNRALGDGVAPRIVVPARTRRALWLAGAGFAAASLLLIWVAAPLRPAAVALAPVAIAPPVTSAPPAELAAQPEAARIIPPSHDFAEPKPPQAMPQAPVQPPDSGHVSSAPPSPAPVPDRSASAGPNSETPAALPPPAASPSSPPAPPSASPPSSSPPSSSPPAASPPAASPQSTQQAGASPPQHMAAIEAQPPAPPAIQAAPSPEPSPPAASPPPAAPTQAPASLPPSQAQSANVAPQGPAAQPAPPDQAPQTRAAPPAAVPPLAPAVGVAAPPVPPAPVAAQPPTALILYTAGAPGVVRRLNSLSMRLRQAGIGQVDKRAVPAGTALGRPVSFFDSHDLALAERAAGVLASEGWPNLPVDELAPRMIRPRASYRQRHVVIEIQLP